MPRPRGNSWPPSSRSARRGSPRRAGTSRYRGRAQRQGGQRRPSRPQHALLDCEIRLPGAQPARTSWVPGCSPRRNSGRFHRCEEFLWRVRCQSAPRGRPGRRSGCQLRLSAADRRKARLQEPHAGLSAVERFMKHYFLIAQRGRRPDGHRVCGSRGKGGQVTRLSFERFVGTFLRRIRKHIAATLGTLPSSSTG